jgi:hypothetical protein
VNAFLTTDNAKQDTDIWVYEVTYFSTIYLQPKSLAPEHVVFGHFSKQEQLRVGVPSHIATMNVLGV